MVLCAVGVWLNGLYIYNSYVKGTTVQICWIYHANFPTQWDKQARMSILKHVVNHIHILEIAVLSNTAV